MSITGKVILLVLVILGKIHMDSWYYTNLKGIELVLLLDIGFSNT